MVKRIGDIWFAPSNPPLTQSEFIEMVETELGQPVKIRVAGPMMMRFLGVFSPEMRETVEMMFEWQHPYVVDTSKAQKAFGLAPMPMEQAIKETLDWLKLETGV
jgi:nucleoside-diphosphate-sugar epimerase